LQKPSLLLPIEAQSKILLSWIYVPVVIGNKGGKKKNTNKKQKKKKQS